MNSYNYLSLKSVSLYFILLAGLCFGYYNLNYSMLAVSLYNIILFLMAILTFFILMKIITERRSKSFNFLQNLLNNLKLLYISFLNVEFGYKLPQTNTNFLKNFVISIENGFVKIWGGYCFNVVIHYYCIRLFVANPINKKWGMITPPLFPLITNNLSIQKVLLPS